MLDQIVTHCFEAGYPFLIGGDYNLEPTLLQEALGASPRIKHEIQILAPTLRVILGGCIGMAVTAGIGQALHLSGI